MPPPHMKPWIMSSLFTFLVLNIVFLQKKKERESAVMKNSKLSEESRQKLLSVMTNDFMSSEESGDDDTIVVHPLTWRSQYVKVMFQRIDAYNKNAKSPQARRQMKQRSNGSVSSRVSPSDAPEWSVSK